MSNYVLLCVGAIFVGIAILLLLWNLFFLLRSEEAEGTIIGGTNIDEHNSASHPIVQFKTRDGQTIEFQDGSFFGFFLTMIMDFYNAKILKQEDPKIKVAYLPGNPKRARIKNFLYLYNPPLFYFGIGVVIIVFSFIPKEIGDKMLKFFERLPF